VSEWRLRLEAQEGLFELLKANDLKFTSNFKMIELADGIGKLLNDSNAKI